MKDDGEQSCDEDLGRVTMTSILALLAALQRTHQTRPQASCVIMDLDQFRGLQKVVLLLLCWVTAQKRLSGRMNLAQKRLLGRMNLDLQD